MMVVEVSTQPVWSAGVPETLFEGQFSGNLGGLGGNTMYDVAPDGQRFVMIKVSEEQEAVGQINIVLNWFEELKRLVPTDN